MICKVAIRDYACGLACLLAGEAFAAAGDNAGAAQMYDQVIVKGGLAYPELFIEASRNYRLGNSTDAAQQVLLLAERLGVKHPGLLAERAAVLDEQGKPAEAENLFREIAKQDPDQPDAVMFMTRQSNREKQYQKAVEYADKLLARR